VKAEKESSVLSLESLNLKLIAFGFALLNILIHLLVINNLEYHRDELLYFSLGMHPAFGYATVPPMIGWLAAIIQWVLGYSVFAVKLFPALLSGVFTLLAIAITRELGGKTYACALTGLATLIMPYVLRTYYFFMPVHVDTFFWAVIIYYTIRYINTEKDKYLVIAGAMTGLAMLNKYLVALLIISLVIALLLTRNFQIFKKKALYLGVLAGFIIFLPNLIWQISNHLPVINHMKELNETQLENVNRVSFLIEQLLSPFTGTLIIIPGLVYLLWNNKYRFLGITALLVIFILFILKGKSYYTQGVMAFLLAAGSVFLERYFRKTSVRIAIPLLLVLLTLPIIPFGIPVYKADGLVGYFKYIEDNYGVNVGRRFEDGSIHSLPQDYADQIGWEELTKHAAEAWQQIPEKDKAFIYCENYGQAGAINIIGRKYGLSEPISFHESFYYWIPESFDPDIEYAIYINNEMGQDVKDLFSEIKVIGKISNVHAREYGTTVYLCSKPVSSFNVFWKERLKN
jgi:hypothetical protein